MTNKVGPVLQRCSEADAVIRAIQASNLFVQVLNLGTYFKVLVPSQCTVTREAIEKELGTRFELPKDLEAIMVSFKGKFRVSTDKAVWQDDETPAE